VYSFQFSYCLESRINRFLFWAGHGKEIGRSFSGPRERQFLESQQEGQYRAMHSRNFAIWQRNISLMSRRRQLDLHPVVTSAHFCHGNV
jgi:hypothetical protein